MLEFQGGACRDIRGLLDSYLSDELSVETNHAVQAHVGQCEGCSRELVARRNLRTQLRRAVTATSSPAGLKDRVHTAIDRDYSDRRPRVWMLAAAACLGVLAAGWSASVLLTGFTPVEYIGHEIYIRELYQEVSQVARLGLGDHVHCAYFRDFGEAEQSAAKTLEELGPEWAPLAAVVADSAPPDWGLRLAHRCNYGGREFVHLAMTGPEGLVSIVVTQRGEEPSMAAAFTESAPPFRILGFTSGDFLGFVVSALPEEAHTRLADAVAPRVDNFLAFRRPAWNS